MRFPRQEYWSGLTFPSLGDLSKPGIEPESPALQANALPHNGICNRSNFAKNIRVFKEKQATA